jgi:hypothetical protein
MRDQIACKSTGFGGIRKAASSAAGQARPFPAFIYERFHLPATPNSCRLAGSS